MDILSNLQQAGLKEPEAKVYLALLECGPATVSPIARQAGVTRTYCYDLLTSLIKQGLASYYEKNNRRRYSAQDPQRIQTILQERLNSFNLSLPELKLIHNPKSNRPRIRFFEGKAGIWTVYEEMLKAKQVDSIYSPEDVYAVFSMEEVEQLARRINKKKMPNRDLYSGSGKIPAFTKFYGPAQQFAWLPPQVNLQTDLIIFADKLALISYRPEVHAVVIESSSIVDTHRQIFELLWQSSKLYAA